MGCLRLGFAIIVSAFIVVFLVAFGGFLGAFIYLFVTAHGMSPQDITSPLDLARENSIGEYIGGSIGGVLGLVIMFAMIRRAVAINWLKRYGTRIIATVTEIESKRASRQVAYTVGKTTQYRTEWYTYYVIVAHWVDPKTKQMHGFRSPNLSTNPKRFYRGCGIEVLIDPNDLGKYYMEI